MARSGTSHHAAASRQLLTLLAAASVFVIAGCRPAEAPTAVDPAEAEVIPVDISVLSTEDAAAEVRAAQGQVAVVNFWATWCGPCVAEMPELSRFYEEFSPLGVEFFSLSVDHPDTVEDRVRPFGEEHRIPFPIIVLDAPDPEDVDEAFDLEIGGAVPATVVYAPDGSEAAAWYEQISYEMLVETVSGLLADNSAE